MSSESAWHKNTHAPHDDCTCIDQIYKLYQQTDWMTVNIPPSPHNHYIWSNFIAKWNKHLHFANWNSVFKVIANKKSSQNKAYILDYVFHCPAVQQLMWMLLLTWYSRTYFPASARPGLPHHRTSHPVIYPPIRRSVHKKLWKPHYPQSCCRPAVKKTKTFVNRTQYSKICYWTPLLNSQPFPDNSFILGACA